MAYFLNQADASGAVEAVKGALLALPQDRVTLRFLMTGTGPVNSGDVQLANASQGLIINFNMEVPEAIQAQTKRLGDPLSLLRCYVIEMWGEEPSMECSGAPSLAPLCRYHQSKEPRVI